MKPGNEDHQMANIWPTLGHIKDTRSNSGHKAYQVSGSGQVSSKEVQGNEGRK